MQLPLSFGGRIPNSFEMDILNGLQSINNSLRAVIAWIGQTEILGITLDIPAHFFIGAMLFYFLAMRGLRTLWCIVWLIVLALAKEAYDLSALLHHRDYLEPLKDLVVTGFGAWFGHYLSRQVK
jgi:hypothetical protein